MVGEKYDLSPHPLSHRERGKLKSTNKNL